MWRVHASEETKCDVKDRTSVRKKTTAKNGKSMYRKKKKREASAKGARENEEF